MLSFLSLPSAPWRRATTILALALSLPTLTAAQAQPPPAGKGTAAASPESTFTVELLETRVRFEADGSGSREVHAVIRLHSEIGIRQFSRLAFGYNRAGEQLEIPTVRIEHTSGGSMEMLPSAIGDRPVAAVADAPAYQDVREKFVRVAGLSPGDRLEYRVLTKCLHPPFAPDFFFSYSFSHETSVEQEILEVDLPAAGTVQVRVSPGTPATSVDKSGAGPSARIVYRWEFSSPRVPSGQRAPDRAKPAPPDVAVSTFSSWQELSQRLAQLLAPLPSPAPAIVAKAKSLAANALKPTKKLETLYDFVAQRIRTVDLPLGATGFHARPPMDILASGYATPEDKFVLFAALAQVAGFSAHAILCNSFGDSSDQVPLPSVFDRLVIRVSQPSVDVWLDPNLEVAPFRVISSSLRGKYGFLVQDANSPPGPGDLWLAIPLELPFAATQQVLVNGSISAAGKLSAHVRYTIRGDNELLLRLAYHHAPREQWKGLAQVMALSDGFHGQVSDVVVSDPLATQEPLTIEYAIAQPGFLNGSKLPARLPVPLPVLGLPEPPAKVGAGPIDLGTPLDIDMHLRLRLPPGIVARVPVPVSVHREYAEFSSSYVLHGTVVTSSRHLRFLRREVAPGDAADYAAFVRAIQIDEAQELTLERTSVARSPRPRVSKSR